MKDGALPIGEVSLDTYLKAVPSDEETARRAIWTFSSPPRQSAFPRCSRSFATMDFKEKTKR